jgi:hypothetical protein
MVVEGQSHCFYLICKLILVGQTVTVSPFCANAASRTLSCSKVTDTTHKKLLVLEQRVLFVKYVTRQRCGTISTKTDVIYVAKILVGSLNSKLRFNECTCLQNI